VSFLRIFFPLSVGVEIDFIDASLVRGVWLGVPCLRAQLDLADLLHGEAAPAAHSVRRYRQAAVAASSKLIEEHVEPSRFPAPHVGTKQSGLSIIDCRYWLPAGSRQAEEFINLAHTFLFGTCGIILLQDTLTRENDLARTNHHLKFMTQ
jgi:hypothetical protein